MTTSNLWICLMPVLLGIYTGGVSTLEVSCDQVLGDSAASCTTCEQNEESHDYSVTCPGLGFKYEISRIDAIDSWVRPVIRINCLNITDPKDFTLRVPSGLKFSKEEKYDVALDKCPLPNKPLKELLDNILIQQVFALELHPVVFPYSLQKTSFEKLDSVYSLKFRDCGLSSLPGEIFEDMTSLKTLIVQENNTPLQFSKETFTHLSQLTILLVSKNLMVHFNPSVLEPMQNLQKLTIQQNDIKDFTESKFPRLSKLQLFELEGNHIELGEIPAGFLDGINNVIYMFLENNQFFSNLSDRTKIPNGSLKLRGGFISNFAKLKIISLAGNNISEIPKDVFVNSSKIGSITLSKNKIKTLFESTFAELVNLKKLNLSENQISQLPENVFSMNAKLTHLYLDYNEIEEIPQSLLKNQENLVRLKLNNNRIRSITGSQFVNLKELQDLDLSNNQITSLLLDPTISDFDYSVLFNCKSLMTLKLDNNSLTEIYEDWRLKLTSLVYISMKNNNVSYIEANDLIFNKRKVTVFLNQNQISLVDFHDSRVSYSTSQILKFDPKQASVELELNPFICNCSLAPFIQFISETSFTNLQFFRFDVDNSTICEDPKGLTMGKAVIEKALSECTPAEEHDCPETCTCKYRHSSYSWVMNCQNSGVDQPPPTLLTSPPVNHTVLNLYNNSLLSFKVPGDKGYDRVTHINLSNNNISQLDISGLSLKLKKLDVSNNKLERLSEETLQLLEKSEELERLELYDNPWSCDCDNARLIKFVRAKTPLMRHSDQLFCSNGTLMLDLQVDKMCS